MSDPGKQITGLVIRADGTIPFDPGCHPQVRANALLWCIDNGHTVGPHPDNPNHLMIRNWKANHPAKA